MFLVHLKVKVRSQKVTRILKSQIGHATRFLANFGLEIRSLCPLGRVQHFSAVYQVKVPIS